MKVDILTADRVDTQVVNAEKGEFMFIQLDPIKQPSNPKEGLIYSDVDDHHLYFHNGTTFKQLDNV